MSGRSVVYITAKVSGELYFIIAKGHEILDVRPDFISARNFLHRVRRGHYIMRCDGVILAYMSSESGNKMPTRIPKELRRQVAIRAGVKKVSHPDRPSEDAIPASDLPLQAVGS